MLSKSQLQRYSAESGLRDIMIAEKEVILTFLLQLLAERGMLNRFAFKGGTCLRKMIIGSQGRFSTDLDFTALEKHDHEAIILEMMDAFTQSFHGIKFEIPDNSYYETQDGLSWGVNPTYTHIWNSSGESEIKIQISRRETPTLAIESLSQCEQSYFKLLPFTPVEINCLSFSEIIAEKIRACYQRNKARDIYDLGIFATKPLDQQLIRQLVVLKLWQSRDTFHPERLIEKFKNGKDFDWEDLGQLVRRTTTVNSEKILSDCIEGYRFLIELNEEERLLANDQYQRRSTLWKKLRSNILSGNLPRQNVSTRAK